MHVPLPIEVCNIKLGKRKYFNYACMFKPVDGSGSPVADLTLTELTEAWLENYNILPLHDLISHM